MKKILRIKSFYKGLLIGLLILFASGSEKPLWCQTNENLINKYELVKRQRTDIPNTGVTSNLKPGQVASLQDIPSIELYPGVSAKMYWGHGALVSIATLKAGAEIPREILPSDRFLFVMEGDVKQLINNKFVPMISRKREAPDGIHAATPRADFVYLTKSTSSALKAGEKGAKIIEVYSPFRSDYMKKAGAQELPKAVETYNFPVKASVVAGKIYDLYDLQYSNLVPGANSRIISGNNIQLSFLTMDPGTVFNRHIHPEEQLMLVFRGKINEIIMDGEKLMKTDDLLLLPGNMVHGGKIEPEGCDVLDIFWPSREDYNQSMQKRLKAYHSIIPENSKVELIIDGSKTKPTLYFTEGPCWLNGKLYFSNMFFDQGWGGSPEKSSIVEWNPDGSYRNITSGKMQANGLACILPDVIFR